MGGHRTHGIEVTGQGAQYFLAGETLHGLARRHDLSRNLVRIWIQKFEAGAFDEEAIAADTIEAYEARIAALERLVGRQALETLRSSNEWWRSPIASRPMVIAAYGLRCAS